MPASRRAILAAMAASALAGLGHGGEAADPLVVEKAALGVGTSPDLAGFAAAAYHAARNREEPRSAEPSPEPSTTSPSPETVLAEMKQNGVTDIVWLPDSETNWLYPVDAGRALPPPCRGQPRGACLLDRRRARRRRGEADDPDPEYRHEGIRQLMRGWLLGLSVPVVMMVGYRGWTRHGVTTDTAATYTEPSSTPSASTTTSSKATPTRRASRSPSRRRGPSARSSSWSATSITASTGKGAARAR